MTLLEEDKNCEDKLSDDDTDLLVGGIIVVVDEDSDKDSEYKLSYSTEAENKQSGDATTFQKDLNQTHQENQNNDVSNLESPNFFHIQEEDEQAEGRIAKRGELAARFRSPPSGDPYEPVKKRPWQYILMSNAYFGSHGMSGTDNNLKNTGRQRFKNYHQLPGETLD